MTSNNAAVRLGSRELFPELTALAYLSHAAISPVSIAVEERVGTIARDYARRGVLAFTHWQADRERLRGGLAELIQARAEDIAFVSNTTHGVMQVAQCFDWRPRDVILLLEGEFPANVIPWQQAAGQHSLELRWGNVHEFRLDRDLALEWLEAELKRGVRMLAISAVQFQTGHRMPLEQISALCATYGTRLFVDGIQGVGAMPVDVSSLGVDFLACGGHKWLMGLEGAGFLYVSPQSRDELVPRTAGWLSFEGAPSFLFEGSGHLSYDRPSLAAPAFMEGATANAVGLAALGAAIELMTSLGVHAIEKHIGGYLDSLESELLSRGFESLRAREQCGRSAILSVLPPVATAVEWQRELVTRGIVCSVPDGYLRFAPHWPNSCEEVGAIAGALDELMLRFSANQAAPRRES